MSNLYQNRHYSEPTTQSIAQPSARTDYTKLNPVSFYQSTTTTTTTRSPPTKPFVKPVNVAAKIEDYSLNVNSQKYSNIGELFGDRCYRQSNKNSFLYHQTTATMKSLKPRTVRISLTIATERTKVSTIQL